MIIRPGALRSYKRFPAAFTLNAGVIALALGASPACLKAAPQEVGPPEPLKEIPAEEIPAEEMPSADGLPDIEDSVFAGDFLAAGVGVVIAPSYVGSDDYQIVPVPVLQGSVGGIGINPRPAGVALNVVPDRDQRVSLQAGPAFRLNFNRAVDPRDELVDAFPRRDIAVELGPTIGVGIDGVLHSVDSFTLTADVLWDVAGAHDGLSVRGSATYFTPVSRGAAVTLSAHTTWIDESYADYYYTVDPALAPGTPLPAFKADAGFQGAGLTSLVVVDLDGDLLNGGLALFGVVNYTRLMGDAAESRFTSIAGSADQVFGGLGIGYTF